MSAELNASHYSYGSHPSLSRSVLRTVVAQKLQSSHHILPTDEYLSLNRSRLGQNRLITRPGASRSLYAENALLGFGRVGRAWGMKYCSSSPNRTLRASSLGSCSFVLWEWRFMGHRPVGLRSHTKSSGIGVSGVHVRISRFRCGLIRILRNVCT